MADKDPCRNTHERNSVEPPFGDLIDCDVRPDTPTRWRIEQHRMGGKLKWDPSRITLHMEPEQHHPRTIDGNTLRARLQSKRTLNACVLDHLFANTWLIPDSWKKEDCRYHNLSIYFWGTIFRGPAGRLFVRGLQWHRDRWRKTSYRLDIRLNSNGLAAILKH